jgi:hypothetical protein
MTEDLDYLYRLGDAAFEVVDNLRQKRWGVLSEEDITVEAGYQIIELMKRSS